MSILGIIAEFNPLHNGHLHLLREAKKKHSFDAIVCVMSGNFTQRGELGICNKWARANMAVQAGVDLVIEIPFCFAVRSAYYFARGSLQLLKRLNIITHLAFACENDDLPTLQSIADIIATEPEDYKKILQAHLDLGLNFPSARAQALQEVLFKHYSAIKTNNIMEIISQPNNILALEYLRIIQEYDLKIKPLVIKRLGSHYHSSVLSSLPSAKAIRNTLQNKISPQELSDSMPTASRIILENEIIAGRAPLFKHSLEQIILYKIRTSPINHLKKIYEIKEGLENRIWQAAHDRGTLEELIAAIKTKRYNTTTINRILLYILFDLLTTDIEAFDEIGPRYMNILALSPRGQIILREIKSTSTLFPLNRGKDYNYFLKKNNNPAAATSMLQLDIMATNIYSLLYPRPAARTGQQDFTTRGNFPWQV